MTEWPGHIGALTDIGKSRGDNQDSYAVRELPEGTLLVVCDGMGGHKGGKLASSMAVETIVQEVESAEIQWNDPHQVNSVLEQALLRANIEVFRAARTNEDAYNMGTTAVVVLVRGPYVHFVHVGDSRLYLLHGGGARRLTRDHTSAQFLIEAGRLTEEEARKSPESHRLMRAIGIVPQVEPDLRKTPLRLQQGDSLLLCSDGLYDVVEGREMALAAMKFGPAEACRRLVELANGRGGPDNITVVIYRREERDRFLDRIRILLERPRAGVPLYLWLLAGTALTTAAFLLSLAVTG